MATVLETMNGFKKPKVYEENRKENRMQVSRNGQDVPAKEELIKNRSESIQKIIREKEQKKEHARQKEKQKEERGEKIKNSFRIPKKKPDVEKLINSLFDDTETNPKPDVSELNDNKHKTDREISEKKSGSSNSSSHKEKPDLSSSTNLSDKSQDTKEKSSDKHASSSHKHHKHSDQKSASSSSSKHSEYKPDLSSGGIRSSSTSKDHKHKSSDTKLSVGSSKSKDSEHSRKDSSSASTKHNLTNSSSSKSHSSSSKSHSSSSKSHSSSSKSHSSSSKSHSSSSSKPKELTSSKPELKPSLPSSPKKAPSPKSSVPQPTTSDQQPIVLNKHHLNPVVERQASSGLSEKEKILARLAAIKQRTLEAIHKESSAKGKRGKGERSHRKTKNEVKHDDKTKSVEIVRDIVSSDDDDDQLNNGVPSALDIMLSERNAKLEKEKITRMAKQAWERATKKDTGNSDNEAKVKKRQKLSKRDKVRTFKHKSDRDDKKSNHKRKEISSSSQHESRKSSPKPKKPVIVRHSDQTTAPPMDFKALLEMAEKKQKEPPKSVTAIPKKKKEEEKRPLTQDEKDRIARKKTKEYQDWLKFGGKPPAKKGDTSDEDELHTQSSQNNVDKKQLSLNSSSLDKHKVLSGSSKQSFNKHTLDKDRSQHHVTANGDSNSKLRNITINENVLVCGPAGSSEDEEPSSNKSQNPFDRIMGQFHKKRPAPQSHPVIPAKKNRLASDEEEEEEYDSEMDDFIDDGGDEVPSYSQEIKKLFGYDRSKYKDEKDEDLSNMEADYKTVMMEEKRSAKLGLKEDLEDMKREQEELKRKTLLKKRK